MDPIAISRSIAKLQYAAVRRPLTVVEERVVAPQRGEGAPVRLGLELSLGWLDRFAGWLLADEQISRRGQALLQRTGHPARAGAPETRALVPVRDSSIPPAWPAGARQAGGQDQDTGGKTVADQEGEDERQVRSAAGGRVRAAGKRATTGDAQARQAGEHAGEQPAGTGTVEVRFTLPAEVQAGTVALCGEFNNWSAQDIRLERGADRSWQATAALEPGRSYRYRYLLDGERWENAWQADRYVPNPYGSTDSVVIVG